MTQHEQIVAAYESYIAEITAEKEALATAAK